MFKHVTSFVGRQTALSWLDEQLLIAALGQQRLMTLTGMGGVGKTRLVRQWLQTSRVLHKKAPQLFFCDCSQATTEADLCHRVSLALAPTLKLSPGQPVLLAHVLSELEHAVLVLDNLEQVVDAAAQLIQEWMAETKDVVFVVTTRERLRLPSEAYLVLSPLPPQDAAQLFVDRAVCIRPSATWQSSCKAVQAIVRTLEGVPLAIELAAAQVDFLVPEQIAEALNQRATLLRDGYRGVDQRHQSVDACMAWSWSLLNATEQHVLMAVSIFDGDFSLQAALTVSAAQPSDEDAMLDGLQGLVRKSLIVRDDQTASPQLRLMMMVRQFAQKQMCLAHDEAVFYRRLIHDLLQRHDHFLVHVWHFANGPDALHADFEQLMTAHRWLMRSTDTTPASTTILQIALLLSRALLAQGQFALAAQTLNDALAAKCADSDRSLYTRALNARGYVYRRLGKAALSAKDLARALSLSDPDDPLRSCILGNLGSLAVVHGAVAQAVTYFNEAHAIAQQHQDSWQLASIEGGRARVAQMQGRLAEARQLNTSALEASLRAGNRRALVRAQARGGYLALEAGLVDEAESLTRQALSLAQQSGWLDSEALAWLYLGNVARRRSSFTAATAHYEAAYSCFQRTGYRLFEAVCLMDQGILLLLFDQDQVAAQKFEVALKLLRAMHNVRCTALIESYLGVINARRSAVAAAAYFEQAEKQLGEVHQGDKDVFAQVIALNRQHLLLTSINAPSDAGIEVLRRRWTNIADSAQMDHLVIAARILSQTLAGKHPTPDVLAVQRTGMCFRWRSSTAVSFAGQPVLQRLLLALATARHMMPGVAVPNALLIAKTWPEETIQSDAALNRLRVSIASLRKRGLGALLIHNGNGYLLDPKVSFVWMRESRATDAVLPAHC